MNNSPQQSNDQQEHLRGETFTERSVLKRMMDWAQSCFGSRTQEASEVTSADLEQEEDLALGIQFVDSLISLLPEEAGDEQNQSEIEDLRSTLELKKMQLESGMVFWDWRPSLKFYVHSMLPKNEAEWQPCHHKIADKVKELPDRASYGIPQLEDESN